MWIIVFQIFSKITGTGIYRKAIPNQAKISFRRSNQLIRANKPLTIKMLFSLCLFQIKSITIFFRISLFCSNFAP